MIYIYRSTDTSAPQLSGTAGTLINVLDACLVNGYLGKPAVGQTKTYTGTNLAVYHMEIGSGMYLAVDDTGTTGARVRGFKTITAPWASAMNAGTIANIGTRPQPMEQQVVGGLYMYKSIAASAVTRSWVLISNGKIFYLYVDVNSDQGFTSRTMAFGDIASYNSNEQNSCALICSEGSTQKNYFGYIRGMGTTFQDHYLCQRYDGLGWSEQFGKTALCGAHRSWAAASLMGHTTQASIVYPDPVNGGMMLSPIGIWEASPYMARGRLPGIQTPCHQQPFNTGDLVVGGVGTPIEGKTFEAFKTYDLADSWFGCYLVETSDTWDDVNYR